MTANQRQHSLSMPLSVLLRHKKSISLLVEKIKVIHLKVSDLNSKNTALSVLSSERQSLFFSKQLMMLLFLQHLSLLCRKLLILCLTIPKKAILYSFLQGVRASICSVIMKIAPNNSLSQYMRQNKKRSMQA